MERLSVSNYNVQGGFVKTTAVFLPPFLTILIPSKTKYNPPIPNGLDML
jgi:hypothetical protein